MPTSSPTLTAADAELLQAITEVIAENDDAVRLPMSVLNQHIADLVAANQRVISRVTNVLTRNLTQTITDNDNTLENIGTVLLTGLNGWIAENDLLLNHLAAASGLIQPGDPLTSALLDQVSEAPELAYSATLLIALRDALPVGHQIVAVLREIRDRLPGGPAIPESEVIDEEIEAPAEIAAPLPLVDWPQETAL